MASSHVVHIDVRPWWLRGAMALLFLASDEPGPFWAAVRWLGNRVFDRSIVVRD